jgi:uncharacterized tellurite resistance protein B-like protein
MHYPGCWLQRFEYLCGPDLRGKVASGHRHGRALTSLDLLLPGAVRSTSKLIMSILRFLGLEKEEVSDTGTETVRKITRALNRMDPEQARYIAAFAYILNRVAHADLAISDDETAEIERIVTEYGKLPEEQSIIVVQMAKTQNLLFGHTENYLVSREFNKIAARGEKVALLHCLFAVSSSDRDVSAAENREIRQIASELKLEHKDFIAVRSSYRSHLSVLKKAQHSKKG